MAKSVHGHDRANPPASALVVRGTRAMFCCFREVLGKGRDIEAQCRAVTVREMRLGTAVFYGICRRNKGERRHYDFVAALNSTNFERNLQSRGAVRDSDRMAAP